MINDTPSRRLLDTAAAAAAVNNITMSIW